MKNDNICWQSVNVDFDEIWTDVNRAYEHLEHLRHVLSDRRDCTDIRLIAAQAKHLTQQIDVLRGRA